MRPPCSFFALFVIILGTLCALSNAVTYRPAVLMHGITSNNESMYHMMDLLQTNFPGMYVVCPNLGDGDFDSAFWGMNHQLVSFVDLITSDPKLQFGFNLLGVSQGGLVARGFIERYNDPPVYNFVSWVSPQGGQFGMPGMINDTWIETVADCCVYEHWAQDLFSWASYWIDPWNWISYYNHSQYLADLNNIREQKNETYKDNILSLNHMSLSYSHNDTVLNPKETGWFEFWMPGEDTTLIPLTNSTFWIDDWIGIRQLYETDRLAFFTTECIHQDYTSPCFDYYFEEFAIQSFNNTLDDLVDAATLAKVFGKGAAPQSNDDLLSM